MDKTFSVILLIIFLFFAFLIMRGLFLKGILHFKLLKMIYPEKLKGIETYFQLLWITNSFKLNFDTSIWFWFPIYYTKISKDNFAKDALELHFKLKRNNKQLAIIFLFFIVFFVIFWMVATKFGS